MTSLSRRDFLKFISAVGGAFCLPGCGLHRNAVPTATAALYPTSSSTSTRPPTATASATPSATPVRTDSEPASPTPAPETPQLISSFQTYSLPPPQMESGLPLMQALQNRRSTRSFLKQELPVQALSNLLWAAFGVNRPATGGRTAPSAYNVQDVDIYLATAQGLYLYDAVAHALLAVLPDDLRSFTGTQTFAANAPVNLVYVSNARKLSAAGISGADSEHWPWAHCGFIAQNVYLFCASAGLATVVRSSIRREELAEKMGLDHWQHILLAQTIGYPA